MYYKTVHKHGYWEVRDKDDKFVCSGDTEMEALRELESMEHEWELD